MEKVKPIESINIPIVSDPRPKAAIAVSDILPQTPELIIMYAGWNNIPKITGNPSLKISFIVS